MPTRPSSDQLAGKFAALSFIDRERFIERSIRDTFQGVIRTLFLRAPVMPKVSVPDEA